jgi:hypothetical protein
MRQLIVPTPDEVLPIRASVLGRAGIPPEAELSDRLARLVEEAEALHRRVVEPRALVETLTTSEFSSIYAAAGRTAPATPLDEIYPRASALALFVATLGDGLDAARGERFRRGDSVLGYVLDLFASDAADRLADWTARWFRASLVRFGHDARTTRVLAYSPGYCGWSVEGQRALFGRLRPVEAGVVLNEMCFMRPVKSVSGVLVAGPAEAHRFRPIYPFCDTCATHECRTRMASVAGRAADAG